MKAKITVVIPAYNMAPWIEDTLRSVMKQTFVNFVCLVIDDGSNDNTHRVFTSTVNGDPRFKIYRQENAGVCVARNVGISLTQTPLISFLDADDLWHETFLEKMVHALTQSDIRLACCQPAMFYDGTCLRKPIVWKNYRKTGNLWWDMLSDCEFFMSGWAAYTCDVKKIDPFKRNVTVAEDREFLLRLLAYIYDEQKGKAIKFSEELLFYRVRQASAVRDATSALTYEWDMMQAKINQPGISKIVQRQALSFLALKMAVIALFGARQYIVAIKKYWQAFVICPWNINLLLLPIRKIILMLLPKREIPWLKHFFQSTTKVADHEGCATS